MENEESEVLDQEETTVFGESEKNSEQEDLDQKEVAQDKPEQNRELPILTLEDPVDWEELAARAESKLEASAIQDKEDDTINEEKCQINKSAGLDLKEAAVEAVAEFRSDSKRWLITIIAFMIVVITFLFKPTNGKKKLMIPTIAFMIVVITFIQLAVAFNRAQNSRGVQNVSTRHSHVQDWSYTQDWGYADIEFEESNSLHNLSGDLQEMTRALNYEMMLEVLEEDFDPLVDIVQVRNNLHNMHNECWYDGYEYWCEWCWYDGYEHWCDSWSGSDNYEDAMEDITDIAHRQLSSRLSAARRRLQALSSTYGISYLVIHNDGAVISSGNDFYELINGEIDFELINLLRDQFAHIVVVEYNQNGRWEVPLLIADETLNIVDAYLDRNGGAIDGVAQTGRIPGMTSLTYQFNLSSGEYSWYHMDHMLEWQNPRNMTFVYGIPHDTFAQFVPSMDLPETDDIANIYYDDNPWDNWWAVWNYASSARTSALWIMVGIVFIIPIAKVKELDRGYERIRKLPIDILALGIFIVWMFVHSHLNSVTNNIINARGLLTRMMFSRQNIQIISFHVLLFVALCLLGYLVHYVKDLNVSKWVTLKNDSLVYGFLAVDLKRGQSLKIFILIFGQIFVGLGIFLIASHARNYEELMLLFLILGYLILVFLYARYKVARVRRDYISLFEITQELADGNLDVCVPVSLGYFDSLKDELTSIQNGLGHAVERALSSERMKGDLITNVSHDLKTPLTSIITYVDLLQVEGLSEEKRSQYLKTLELKTERLRMLIEDLFDVSKASSGNLQLDLREVDVVTLMRQTVLGLEDRIMEAGLILREGYPEESIKMELDGGRMHRVFENLIINMVKYAMPNTRAYIDITNSNGSVKIILRNISAREINVDMNDLSERFVRGEESRTTEGSGLGLAIAKSFVELQGGTFEIIVDGDLFKVIMTF